MSNHNQPSTGSPLGTDSGEPSLSQAQPYRTPANVSDGVTAGGALRSPLLWITAASTTGFLVVGAFILSTPTRDFNKNRRPVKPIPQYVEDFGNSRIPPEDLDDAEDIVVMQPLEAPVSGPRAVMDGPPVP
ncbi:MAG: hypothetical protein F9B45_02800 [Phycisphaera sp. RhM]|nr:hypothetical protein [Phycisphaera sp. RhM]